MVVQQDERTRIVIVGIGADGLPGLTAAARRVVEQADLILGAAATLGLVAGLDGRTEALDADMETAVEQVRAAAVKARRPILISGGDPLFYGVARYLCDRLGKDRFDVLPHVSTMQLAFARVKESWEDAYLTSLAGRPLEAVLDRIRIAEKVGLFPGEGYTPASLAQALLQRGLDDFRAYVCENLGSPDERVTQADLPELARMDFDPLNVLILVRKPGRPTRVGGSRRHLRFGNPDDAFRQSQPQGTLITQAEVRSIALAQMDVLPAAVVWDIGAGSGSVAIEAAQLATAGIVYAIEPSAADLELIRANAEAFGVANVRPVAGRAPEVLADLPDPDCVFIGGTGRRVPAVLQAAYERLAPGGRLAVNVASIDNLAAAHATLKELAGSVSVWNVTISRGIEQLDLVRFQAAPPSFLLAVAKPV